MWHTWTLLCYTAESCDHGWLTKLLKAAEPDKGHIVASVIKLIALVAHVPNICSKRCMGDVHDTVMWPRSPLLFIIYGKKKKKSFCLVGGWGGWGWGFDWYLSQLQVGGTSAGQGPERSMLCFRCLLPLINDCLEVFVDCICCLFFSGWSWYRGVKKGAPRFHLIFFRGVC